MWSQVCGKTTALFFGKEAHRREMGAAPRSINEKSERLLALQGKVESSSRAIARLKAVWPFVAAGIALAGSAPKGWLFGQK